MDLNLILEENRNKKSTNKDFYTSLQFERTANVIPVSDINKIVNTYKVFEDERNACDKYRLNITLNPIMSNVLTNMVTEVKKTDGTYLNDSTTPTRLSAIQSINDSLYEYRLGYDIFDNNFMRFDTFLTGSTVNSFSNSLHPTSLYGDLLPIKDAVESNLVEDNGWVGISNKTKINGIKMS